MRMRAVAAVLFVVVVGVILAGCSRATPPTISTQPSAQTACVGGAVTFSVTAAGTAPLSYQWRKDGTNIPGATNATYTISSVTTGSAGNYTVVVTNKAGTVTSTAASLTVNVPPTISAQPASQSACLGQSVLLSVTAAGTAPLSYQWRKDGTNIAGATTAIYTIPAATAADAGAYTVVVTNPCGSVTSTPATLALDAGVTIATQPSPQSVCEGRPATFTVVATGAAPLSYQWQKDGLDIPGATEATYTVPAAAGPDAGTYAVIVTSACGTATSDPVPLTVSASPAITVHPASQTVQAGSAVTFAVTATGTPPLSYQWRKDGADIPGATAGTYAISSATAADAGTYTAVVTNACGAAVSTPAILAVTPTSVEPTPPPTTDGAFVTVNDHPISRAAFDDIRQSILSYYARLYAQFGIDIRVFLVGARGRMFELELELSALTGLVTRGIVEGEAAKRGIAISPDEIDAEFERQYQAMLETYGITEEYLIEYFAAQGGTLDEFKEEGRASITEQLLYDAVQKAVVGPIEITDDELREYFEAHKADYATAEQVEASHILVATEEEAQAILDELAAGADFAELARTRSTDPGSGARGGQLGWFGRGVMVPEFEEAAFALEVGETSGIVQSQFGFHIIRVTDRRAATEPEFADIADRVRRDLESERTTEAFQTWLKTARQEARVVIADPILSAMYEKDLDLDRGIAAFERLQAEGKVEEKYLSFIIGSLYEDKMAMLESDIELLETQLPEGPEREAQITALQKSIDEARAAALAAYYRALKELPDDEDVKERIIALEGSGLVPR
ncbi:MAG: hypothetical protein BIP78_1294 [Candidatus Bipolaricaulis sibiricus]|uniref:peptidylprolyl isomerase n=1 Tax=Bipolaricaulis sibiricus TaxID=2501609 RepID=A0A410FVX0_BIPS1|nr:MAG: hypothetical protein BIP78_1294 [Candidatus Bipolaricaulis sibiricus]